MPRRRSDGSSTPTPPSRARASSARPIRRVCVAESRCGAARSAGAPAAQWRGARRPPRVGELHSKARALLRLLRLQRADESRPAIRQWRCRRRVRRRRHPRRRPGGGRPVRVPPVGVFYALSRPLVARLLPSATRLATRLGDDRLVPCSGKWECGQYRRKGVIEDPRHLDRFERHEDLLLGHAISKIGEDVTYVQWGRTVFRDLDAANGPRDYAAIERKCLGELRPPVAEAELPARPRAGARRDGGADVGGGSPRQGRGAVAARLGDGGGLDAADRAQRQARVRLPAGGGRVAAQPHAERGG